MLRFLVFIMKNKVIYILVGKRITKLKQHSKKISCRHAFLQITTNPRP